MQMILTGSITSMHMRELLVCEQQKDYTLPMDSTWIYRITFIHRQNYRTLPQRKMLIDNGKHFARIVINYIVVGSW